MPWIYHQAAHALYHNGTLVSAAGYAGKKPWKNLPAFQGMSGGGPLPQGKYSIDAPFHHSKTGPYSMRLTPSPANHMFGRSGFLIHGANPQHADDSSDGCIVLPQALRAQVWGSGDHQLEVVP